MSTTQDPSEAPLQTLCASGTCQHRATRTRRGDLLVRHPSLLPQILIILLFIPVLLYLCHWYGLRPRSPGWVVAILIPVFGSAACVVGQFFIRRVSTEITFLAAERRIHIQGWVHGDHSQSLFQGPLSLVELVMDALRHKVYSREFQFDDVVGIQLMPAAYDKHVRSYQLNLKLADGSRYNLLNCGGRKRMTRIATEVAAVLDLPLDQIS